jgi:ribosomal-protein-alanine N-acetyltransferase
MSVNFETDRLLLKTLSKEDASMVLSFYKDNMSLFEPWEPKRNPNFYTLPYHKSILTAESNLMSEGRLYRYWVFLKNNPNEIIGSICFQNLLYEPYRSCCIGYKFDHRYQHQGFASESIRKSIEIMFKEHQIHRMEAFIMDNNLPSLHLIEKLSFHFEGLCCSYARINGIWTDHRRYALINPMD